MRTHRGSNATPPGQPVARPRLRYVQHNGKQHITLVLPHQVVTIHTKKDVEDALEFYHEPIPSIAGSQPKNQAAWRWQLEWLRPALRWYCKAFGVTVPHWLKGNGWEAGMGEQDRKRFFGDKPLRVREFVEEPRAKGVKG